jgi:Ca2+-binding RTX toxin-like protein
MLLPDLTPWLSRALGFGYDWIIQGNDLRLTSAVSNIGSGALEIRGGAIHDHTQDVYQRIYAADGSYTDVLAGSFIYHPEHDHIHFEDFAQFRLREVLPDGGVGDVVAAGEKLSFCLLDVERHDTSGPASPRYLTCGQVQGISVGWADVYHRGLPGQSIDITNVVNGSYWLEIEVDPDNNLRESDETNNIARIQIDLSRPGGSGPISPDTFEPSDSFDTAAILAPPEDHTYDDLSIHASLNDDFYRITASVDGAFNFILAFSNAEGDLDMEVFDESRTLLGRSVSVTDREHITISAVAGEYYYVRVFGYEGATNSLYTLTIDTPLGREDDPFTTNADIVALHHPYGIWHALAGDDQVTGTNTREIIYGDGGKDTLAGQAGSDDLYGGADNDLLKGGSDDDWLDGGAGIDTAAYTSAPSAVTVDLMTNTASGGDGTDTLVSIESMWGSQFDDFVRGSAAANAILGYDGADRIDGRAGNDALNGGNGLDVITGGAGRDVMTGGTGNDVFDFNVRSESGNSSATRDLIIDFRHLIDDINVRDIDASAILSGNNNFVWRGSGAFNASTAGELRFVKYDKPGTSNDYTIIYGDTDRDTASEFQIMLKGLVSLTSADFVL